MLTSQILLHGRGTENRTLVYRLKADYFTTKLYLHGGDGRNRAFDLLRMKQLFYRLNYITIIENTAIRLRL